MTQRRTVQKLGDGIRGVTVAADVEDRENVGMRERGHRLRFALESRPPIGVTGYGRRQHLDGDVAVEPGVPGSIDLAHAAGAKRGGDLVGTEARANRERHRLPSVTRYTSPMPPAPMAPTIS